MSIWDDPTLQGDEPTYVNLVNQGDVIEGDIIAMRTKTWDDGRSTPQLDLTMSNGAVVTWTAGQVQAQRQLKMLRPDIGDHVRAELVDVEKRGSKTLKHITIDVTPGKGGSAGAAASSSGASAAPAGAGGAPSGMDPAAWSRLDDATRDQVLAKMGIVTASASGRDEPPF